MGSKLEQHAEQLSALGHPVRLSVVRFVVQAGPEGATAGDIQAHVDLAASTLSHHLKRLVASGLLTTRGEANFHYYAADFTALRALTDYLLGRLLQARQGLLLTRGLVPALPSTAHRVVARDVETAS